MCEGVVDLCRLSVLQAYRNACRREGIKGDGLVALAITRWCCHRPEFVSDLPVEPAASSSERDARDRACATVFEVERALGEAMPGAARGRLAEWASAPVKCP